MKSKNIPHDIKRKSIEEAKKEVLEIVETLEKEGNIKKMPDKYDRLMYLNEHIEFKFKDKLKKVSKLNFKNSKNLQLKK